MEINKPAPIVERNPITHERHRREVFWQITVPVILVVISLLVLAGLVVFQTTALQTSVLADISLMWLIVPALFIALILMLFLGGSVYLSVWLIRELPIYFRQAHMWLLYLGTHVDSIGNQSVKPIIRLQSFNASMRSLGRQFRRK